MSVLGSAFAMAVGTFLSRILGLVREWVFAFVFGASAAMDAFNVAFRIPNLFRDLFAEGALSAALVPVFVDTQEKEGPKRSWRVAGLVFRVLFCLTTLLALIGWIYARELVVLFAPSYGERPEQLALTVDLVRIMLPFFPLISLAAAYMGILNSHGKFFLPAFASALFNLTSVGVGLLGVWLAPFLGIERIAGMAWGVVVGGAVQAFVQLPLLYKVGYRYPGKSEIAWFRDPALKKILLLMAPGALGMAATQVNVLINTVLASSLEVGAVSWLNYSFRLMQFPIGLFGVSLASATLPVFARFWSSGEQAQAAETLKRSMGQVLAINLPAAVGLGALSVPIVQVIFEYGQFTHSDTLACASALALYAVGLPFYSVVKVLVPACYAVGRTRIAVTASIVAVIANIIVNVAIVNWLGFRGLALGTSISAVLNSSLLAWALPLGMGHFFVVLLRQIAVASAMGVVCTLVWNTLDSQPFVGLFAAIFAGVASLFVIGKAFKIPETIEVIQLFIQFLRRKLLPRSLRG